MRWIDPDRRPFLSSCCLRRWWWGEEPGNGLPAACGRQDSFAHLCSIARRKNRSRDSTTQRDGLTKGSNEILAAWARSEVPADLLTNVARQLVVDKGRQRAENAETAS